MKSKETLETSRTPILGLPLLTEAQKIALIEQEDHGVVPANVTRFATYDDWKNRFQTNTHNLGMFLGMDSDSGMFAAYRELQCFQRMSVLEPDLIQEIGERVATLDPGQKPDEDTDKMIWDAYEKMASLTDIHDIDPNQSNRSADEPINPNYLLI